MCSRRVHWRVVRVLRGDRGQGAAPGRGGTAGGAGGVRLQRAEGGAAEDHIAAVRAASCMLISSFCFD